MDKYKKLVQNSIVFAIGNLGSKLLLIVLVPLYTYHLSAEQYGVTDLILTTTSMLLPIVSLSIYESTLRFVMDKEEGKGNKLILFQSIMINSIGLVFFFLITMILFLFNLRIDYLFSLFIILGLQSYQIILSQFTRAVGKVKLFSVNGIIQTLLLGLFNILFIVYFGFGVLGYLLAIILSNICSVFILIIGNRKDIFNNESIYIDKNLIKRMLMYSLPLIPNAFMWWLMNASNRYFILFFIGASANGLFAVASKIPSVLTMIQAIFFQAWQISAIEEFSSKNSNNFYSSVFNTLSKLMFIATSAILVMLKPILLYTLSEAYANSWKFVPFLLIGVIFSSFASFLGTTYIAAKKTTGVLTSTLIGGVVSLVLNAILVPIFGVNGAGLSTMLSFLFIWILRMYDTQKYIKIIIDKKNFFISLLILFTQIFVLYSVHSNILENLILLVLFLSIIVLNRSIFIKIKGFRMKK